MNPYISQRIAAVSDPVIPVIAGLIAANPGTISMGQGVVGCEHLAEGMDRLMRGLQACMT